MAIAQAVGLFNVFVGLMLTASILLMVGGLIIWVIRFGTWPTYREEAFEYMKWAIAILFVLNVLLAVAQLVQKHLDTVLFGLGFVGFIVVIGFLAFALLQPREQKKEEH